jgi:hypothetical protein
MWPGLVQTAKQGGVDVIETYVFWNGHELSPGNVSNIINSFKCTTWIACHDDVSNLINFNLNCSITLEDASILLSLQRLFRMLECT